MYVRTAITSSLLIAAITATATAAAPPITWEQYYKDCGLAAQEANSARSEAIFHAKYEGKKIEWTGTVHSVDAGWFGGFDVSILISPTDSSFSGFDIIGRAKNDQKSTILLLDKGSTITFAGVITRQGGSFTSHSITLTSIKVAEDQESAR
jgi:hypothetical protein